MGEVLTKKALKTVIRALCAPAKRRDDGLFDARGDQGREEALKTTLPALSARTSAKRLRGRLLAHGDEKLLAAPDQHFSAAVIRVDRPWCRPSPPVGRHQGCLCAHHR
ncbi:hypothetical protein GTW52_30225 [Streptomyces sp. SID8358]|uniref:hypothetical protein n=1 Tax=Streptomyces sp. SID8358 TaxID=2690342 RepID=UPI000DAB7C68|nr:hypothetical protein [Streptomyces sp. SID8358]MYU37334.1 hypothetical protein [Streptomyces sp. SID8358]